MQRSHQEGDTASAVTAGRRSGPPAPSPSRKGGSPAFQLCPASSRSGSCLAATVLASSRLPIDDVTRTSARHHNHAEMRVKSRFRSSSSSPFVIGPPDHLTTGYSISADNNSGHFTSLPLVFGLVSADNNDIFTSLPLVFGLRGVTGKKVMLHKRWQYASVETFSSDSFLKLEVSCPAIAAAF
ncbi:hypothetical protein F2P81_006489 [Scophthalmus maximus]|uniref:Uncharacterized protein n=1 Tax=Scophthalmus maximus TaxID=52904 RepID=A0A6A4TCE6_SCOMX|nr:hypothetical protein F2P81_006489 [Scophthalmus maximus]